jgi:hypothetical protein
MKIAKNTLFNLIKETINEVLAETRLRAPDPWRPDAGNGFTDRPAEVPPDWAEGPMEPIPLPDEGDVLDRCPDDLTEEECEAWQADQPELDPGFHPEWGGGDWDIPPQALEEINRMVDKTVDRVISKKRPSTP